LAKLVGRTELCDAELRRPDAEHIRIRFQSLLDQMNAAARPAADRDMAKKLAALKQIQPGSTKLEPWDNGYGRPVSFQKQSYGYDRQEARNYSTMTMSGTAS
jgi:Zn-dependent oligopeptidase